MNKYLAEMFGTMVLVLMGCGVAVSLPCSLDNPASVVGTALAFGLAVVAMAYTIGELADATSILQLPWEYSSAAE